jgi:hypothetical protein
MKIKMINKINKKIMIKMMKKKKRKKGLEVFQKKDLEALLNLKLEAY